MKTSRTFLTTMALFGLVACGGSAIVGADGGTGGTVSVPCTDCLAESIGWGPNGGLVAYTDSSSITGCRTFTHVRTPGADPGPSKECSVEIGGCDAGPPAIHELEEALAHPDVKAAFAGSVTLFGSDPRPCDGSVLAISKGSESIEVGGACDAGTACFAGETCVPIPAGVSALADVLWKLEQRALSESPCSDVFP
jgi:hypothetical protein